MTREEFLNEYQPEYKTWASKGEVESPSDAKIEQGWVVEHPRHTLFNWYMRRADERLAKLEAKVAWLESKLAENS